MTIFHLYVVLSLQHRSDRFDVAYIEPITFIHLSDDRMLFWHFEHKVGVAFRRLSKYIRTCRERQSYRFLYCTLTTAVAEDSNESHV